MTDTPNRKQVEVTQADRDAAAPLLAGWWRNLKPDKTAEFAREGSLDNHELVQAFARHRLASEQAQAARIAELEAQVSALSSDEAWQPIDGTEDASGEVLVSPGCSASVTVAYLWRGDQWIDVLDGNRVIQPTHWRPLPAPPDDAKLAGEDR